jgi:hypothetical protein
MSLKGDASRKSALPCNPFRNTLLRSAGFLFRRLLPVLFFLFFSLCFLEGVVLELDVWNQSDHCVFHQTSSHERRTIHPLKLGQYLDELLCAASLGALVSFPSFTSLFFTQLHRIVRKTPYYLLCSEPSIYSSPRPGARSVERSSPLSIPPG